MTRFFHPLLVFFLHLGFLGPLILGVLDSSFLVLPFGNDLLVVDLIAQHHKSLAWYFYVIAASVGSTVGVLVLTLVGRRFGEEGIRKVAGEKRYQKLKRRLGDRTGMAVAFACIAPPPFPFTVVIAAAAALDYATWKMLTINFVARLVRFSVLGFLAIRYGKAFLRVTHSTAFLWGMIAFIALCLIATAYSAWHWIGSSGSAKRSRGPMKFAA